MLLQKIKTKIPQKHVTGCKVLYFRTGPIEQLCFPASILWFIQSRGEMPSHTKNSGSLRRWLCAVPACLKANFPVTYTVHSFLLHFLCKCWQPPRSCAVCKVRKLCEEVLMYDYSTSFSWPYILNSHFQLYHPSSAELTHLFSKRLYVKAIIHQKIRRRTWTAHIS